MIQTITTYITFAILLSNFVLMLSMWGGKAKAPAEAINDRISALESEVSSLKDKLDDDNKRINSITEGNRVTQQALLALMSHAINGNDIERLKEAKTSLEEYLIKR